MANRINNITEVLLELLVAFYVTSKLLAFKSYKLQKTLQTPSYFPVSWLLPLYLLSKLNFSLTVISQCLRRKHLMLHNFFLIYSLHQILSILRGGTVFISLSP